MKKMMVIKLGVLGLGNETMKAQMVAADQLFNIFGDITAAGR